MVTYILVTVHVYNPLSALVSGIRRSFIIASVPRPIDIWHMIGVRCPVLELSHRRGHSRSYHCDPASTLTQTIVTFFDDHGQWRRYSRYWWLWTRRKSHRTRYQHRARGFTIRKEAGRDLDLCQFQRWRSKVESLPLLLHLVYANTRIDESLLGILKLLASCLKSTSRLMSSTLPP